MSLNLCESCKTVECSFRKDGRFVHACHSHEAITRSDLASKDAEIAKMQEQFRDYVERSESDAMELRKEIAHVRGIMEAGEKECRHREEQDRVYRTKITILENQIADLKRGGVDAAELDAIPADRELMRLVDELIRWHGLRPLDKRPDHAAALVGAIKALRAQPTQELAP